MKAHEAAKSLVSAERNIKLIIQTSGNNVIKGLAREAYQIILDVGDGLYPEIIREIRAEKVDPMM